MAPDVVALVSVGLHPESRRARRADLDARALELALRAAGSVTALHAGTTAALPTVRDYLGMGAERLVALDVPPGSDPLPALAQYLTARRPGLIVAGARAEAGECSGMVPFCLAEQLGYGLATSIVELALEGKTVRLIQAMAGGRRRALAASLPLVVTVDRSGPQPRASALARSKRMPVAVESGSARADERSGWTMRPSRPRPRRLAAPKTDLQAAESDASGRREMINPDPVAAADAILDFLALNGLFEVAPAGGDPSNQGSAP